MSRLPRWVATSIFVFLNDCSCCMICIWYYVKIELLRGERKGDFEDGGVTLNIELCSLVV